jgi:ubiquinol-cytochrome c reductase cytochrome b subunit
MTILKSIWRWVDDRLGLSALVVPAATHPVPPGSRWLYVFGSATLFAFLVQVVTGVVLATIYVPSAGEAYQSLEFITHRAILGNLIRGIHYWGASAMVLLIGIHMIRVFLTGAFKFPREMNWLSGVLLLGLTLGMGFTGQLLRWDQNAIWSVVVGAEQAGRTPLIGTWLGHFVMGGGTLGGATLTRFFALHVFVLPGLIFAVVGLHVFLVLRHGISEPAKVGRPVDPSSYRKWYQEMLAREGEPFWPNAAWRDAFFGALVVVAIVLLAAIFGPPLLDKPPDPAIVQAAPRPDWYFLWYFAVLALLPHSVENAVMILAPLTAALVLLLLPFLFGRGERHPRRRPWAVAAVLMILIMIGTLWIAGVHANWSPDFSAKPLSAEVVGATTGPVAEGADLFYKKACIYCHDIAGDGGHRGPVLTEIGDRLTADQMRIRILNGGYNMPAFGAILTPGDVDKLVAFLQTRRSPE